MRQFTIGTIVFCASGAFAGQYGVINANNNGGTVESVRLADGQTIEAPTHTLQTQDDMTAWNPPDEILNLSQELSAEGKKVAA